MARSGFVEALKSPQQIRRNMRHFLKPHLRFKYSLGNKDSETFLTSLMYEMMDFNIIMQAHKHTVYKTLPL